MLDELDPNLFRRGMTPLMYAAKKSNIRIINKIIQKGGDPSIVDVEGRSPLMYAAYSGNAQAADILTVARPKTVKKRDVEGFTAANHAYVEGHQRIIRNMMRHGFENRLPLHTLERLKEVQVTGIGKNIENIDIEVKNKSQGRKSVVILPGTVFYSNDDSQNMVCTSEYSFDLRFNESFQSRISTACIDGEKEIPRSHNTFGKTSYKDANLIKIVNKMKYNDPRSLQAAVWAYKNNYSGQEIMNKLYESNTRRSVITREHITEAREALRSLEIYKKFHRR